MQLVTWCAGPNALADGGADRAWNSHDHFARRQLAGPGADSGRLALARADAINIGLGTDPFDRLNSEVEGKSACRRIAGDHKVLRTDAENAVARGHMKVACLTQCHQVHGRGAYEGSDKGSRASDKFRAGCQSARHGRHSSQPGYRQASSLPADRA